LAGTEIVRVGCTGSIPGENILGGGESLGRFGRDSREFWQTPRSIIAANFHEFICTEGVYGELRYILAGSEILPVGPTIVFPLKIFSGEVWQRR
jgi:hypothetical protein